MSHAIAARGSVCANPGGRSLLAQVLVATALALTGCASSDDIRGAIHAVNEAFQADYAKIRAEMGTRRYRVPRGDVFVALHAALSRLGMRIADQDPDLGTLVVDAPAPRPLDAAEWRQAGESDLPRLREIASRHVGVLAAQTIRFEPEGLEIVIHATVVEVAGETEVALTARMNEVAPPRSGMPRREYPPPTAIRMALAKIWAQLDAELRAARRIP